MPPVREDRFSPTILGQDVKDKLWGTRGKATGWCQQLFGPTLIRMECLLYDGRRQTRWLPVSRIDPVVDEGKTA